MKDIICIICPKGCCLHIDDEGNISGQGCKRGIIFAEQEKKCPLRTFSTTVATIFPSAPVVSVKVTSPVPLKSIPDIMKQINKIQICKKMKIGDIVLDNILGLGVDIILTSDILNRTDIDNCHGGI